MDILEKKKLSNEDTEILLKEYEKSQDSAEHHNTLTWLISSIFLTGSIILLSGIIPHLNSIALIEGLLLSILGIFINILVWLFSFKTNRLSEFKYKRCKKIEEKLGMTQHLDTERYFIKFLFPIYSIFIIFKIVIWFSILLYFIIKINDVLNIVLG